MIYSSMLEAKVKGKKQLAVLIDPDNVTEEKIIITIEKCELCEVNYIFVGGSLLVSNQFEDCIKTIKKNTSIPVILFPGSPVQISNQADAILFLSLISGRNPEMLIGNHVIAASSIKKANIEILPTGYMLIDGGKPTTASYMSNATPIPSDKVDIAVSTAMAGEMLGLKLLYLDAGSGARVPVSERMIEKVKENISVPLLVGGGIKSPKKAIENCKAGADVIVIGNAVEKDVQLIDEISKCITTI